MIQIDPSTFVILYCQEIIPAREVTLDDVRDQIVSNIRKMREVIAAGEFYANTVKKASIVDNITGQVVTPRQNRPEELMANPTLDTTRR